jgi:hypothetical protein
VSAGFSRTSHHEVADLAEATREARLKPAVLDERSDIHQLKLVAKIPAENL